jgi:hypothetical protein
MAQPGPLCSPGQPRVRFLGFSTSDAGLPSRPASARRFSEFASAAIEPCHVLTEPTDRLDVVVGQVLSAFEQSLPLYRIT